MHNTLVSMIPIPKMLSGCKIPLPTSLYRPSAEGLLWLKLKVFDIQLAK